MGSILGSASLQVGLRARVIEPPDTRTENPRVGGSIPPLATILLLALATLTRRPEKRHLAQEAITPKAVSRAQAEPILLPTQSVVLVGRHRYGGHFHGQ